MGTRRWKNYDHEEEEVVLKDGEALKLNISFDGEENGYYIVILFPIFFFPITIWYNSILKSLQRQ